MKNIITSVAAFSLVACATVPPPPRELPDAGAEKNTACVLPRTLADTDTSAADSIGVVAGNYNNHRICAAKVDAWIKFYNDLRGIK